VQRFGKLWDQLAAENQEERNIAIEMLAGMPEQSLPLLLKRLRDVKASEAEKKVAGLIDDLSDSIFKIRESATEELKKMGPEITPLLCIALDKGPSLEARRRLSQIIDALPLKTTPTQERLQNAVCAIELMATSDALAALKELAAGSSGGVIGLEAATALKRSPSAPKKPASARGEP